MVQIQRELKCASKIARQIVWPKKKKCAIGRPIVLSVVYLSVFAVNKMILKYQSGENTNN